MHQPRHLHLAAIKRIICYLLGTTSCSIFYKVRYSLTLQAYNDVDWARCPHFCQSTIGWYMHLGDVLNFWKCKKQERVFKSSTEAEYHAM